MKTLAGKTFKRKKDHRRYNKVLYRNPIEKFTGTTRRRRKTRFHMVEGKTERVQRYNEELLENNVS